MRAKLLWVVTAVLIGLAAWLLLRGEGTREGDGVGVGGAVEGTPGPLPDEEGVDDPSLRGRGEEEPPEPGLADGPVSARGRVIDPEGNGVPGIVVVAALRPPQPPYGTTAERHIQSVMRPPPAPLRLAARTTTDERGRFALRGLAVDQRYRIETQPSERWSRASVEPYAFPPYASELFLVVGEGRALRVRVVDGKGNGLRAVIDVWSEIPWGRVTQAELTDADGRKTIPGVPQGTVRITVRVPGRGTRSFLVSTASDEEIVLAMDHPGGAVVTGRVLKAGGEPIAGAIVVASVRPTRSDDGTWIQRAARSDANGTYRIDGFPAGNLDDVCATADGCLAGRHGAGRRALSAGQTIEVDIELRPGLMLEGRVVDEDGSPLADTRVRAKCGKIKGEAVSGPQGACRLGPLPPGRLFLSAFKKGWYMPEQAEGRIAGDAPRALALEFDESTAPFTLVMRKGLTLGGRCVDREGRALPDILVRAAPDWSQLGGLYELWADAPLRASSDDSGGFRLEGVIPGTQWNFYAEGKAYLGQRGPVGPWKADAEAEPVVLVLDVAARLSGIVVDEGDAPVAGVRVRCAPMNKQARTDAEGAFALEGLNARGYELRVFDGSAKLADFPVFDLAWGEHREDVRIVVPLRHRLRGRVVDVDGEPASYQILEVLPAKATTGKNTRAQTGAEGRFDVRVWGAGPYRIEAQGREIASSVDPGPEELRLVLANEYPPLTIRVVDEAGVAVPKVRITVERRLADGGSGSWPSEVDGGRLEIGSSGRARITSIAVDEPRDASDQPLSLLPTRVNVPPEQREVEVVLEPGLRITGTLRDENGRPVPGQQVTAVGSDASRLRKPAVTDADGAFALETLRPGVYRLTWGGKGAWLPGGPLQVVAGTKKVDLRVERGEPFVVSVVGPDGEPLSAVRVSLFTPWRERHVSRRGRTDEDGRCVLEGVPRSATFRIEARTTTDTGASYPHSSVTDQPYGEGSILLRMSRGVYIEGVVFAPDGTPVRSGRVRAANLDGKDAGRGTLDGQSNAFRLGPLEPGPYRVHATGTGPYASSAEVEVTAPARGLRLVLRGTTSIEGRIRDMRGGKWFLQWSAGREGYNVTVNPDGRFTLTRVPDGAGTLFGQELDGARYVLLENVDPTTTNFELAPVTGQSVAGRIEGEGAGYVGLTRGPLYMSAQVADDGSFEVKGVPGGTWKLSVVGKNMELLSREGVAAGTTDLVLKIPSAEGR